MPPRWVWVLSVISVGFVVLMVPVFPVMMFGAFGNIIHFILVDLLYSLRYSVLRISEMLLKLWTFLCNVWALLDDSPDGIL